MEEKKTEAVGAVAPAKPKERVVIDWMELFVRCWMLRRRFLKVACLGALVGLVVSLSIPKQYAVSVVLAPEATPKTSGLASMAASFLGANLQTTPNAVNAMLAPEIVSSTPFMLELLDVSLAEVGKDLTLSAYLEEEAVPWWTYVLNLPRLAVNGVKSWLVPEKAPETGKSELALLRFSSKEAAKIRALRNRTSVYVDTKTSIITLTVAFQDALVTAKVAQTVIDMLQKYIVNYKISKAKEDCAYWQKLMLENKEKYYEAQQRYAAFVDANAHVIYQRTAVERERLQNEVTLAYQVYSQVEQQLQMAKAKVQESKPAFTMLEPPVVPNRPSGNGKLMMMVMFACLALALAMGWELFIREVAGDFSRKLKQATGN